MIHRSAPRPFGEEINPFLDPAEGHRFTAHWREYRGTERGAGVLEGLDFMHAREYDWRIGRFTAPDPARDGWNAYAYVSGNPVNFVDPEGLRQVVGEGWNGLPRNVAMAGTSETMWDSSFSAVPLVAEGDTISLARALATTVALYLAGTSDAGDDVLILNGVYLDPSGKIVALDVHGFPVQIQGDPSAINRSWTILSTRSYTIITSNGPRQYTIIGAGAVNGRSPEGVRNWISANYGKKHWSYEYQCYDLATEGLFKSMSGMFYEAFLSGPSSGTTWWKAHANYSLSTFSWGY